MNNRNDIKKFYEERVKFYKAESEKYTSEVRNTNIYRGLSFLIGTILSIICANYSLHLMTITIVTALIVFSYFVAKNSKSSYLKKYNYSMQIINENELKAINNDNSNFKKGEEFINKNHNFSYDLDIFGDKSIFQKINRCATKSGYELLAERIQNPSLEIKCILETQKNTQLFENEVEARQIFLAKSQIYEGEIERDNIKVLTAKSSYFSKSKFWKIFPIICITCTISTILLSAYGLINYYIPALLFVAQLTITIWNSSKTKILSEKVDKNAKAFKKYFKLFEVLVTLKNVPEKYNEYDVKEIIVALKELAQISSFYEQKSNLVIAFLGEGIFLYDILINIKFEKWQEKYSNEVENWFEMITEYDFLFSLANLKFNNPDWCLPEPTEEKFVLEAQNAGHPLIASEKCVKNNIQFSKCNYMIILTGANMAGKSTYLRTIGTNLILSQLGSVVCADSFKFTPTQMITSIRTNDSVQDNESYFFAELKRLKKIVEKLEKRETLFIIVDEMLRGTNSKDKHDGSQKFVEKLLNYNCYGIFATHDIDIGNMRENNPQHIDTKCFEISFKGDDLVFDYKLKDGISQNLNASYLMKKMGIIN